MTTNVMIDELADGRFAARLMVDFEVVHEVIGYDRMGAIAALASATEADLDEAMSLHAAVKSSLQAIAEQEQQKNITAGLKRLADLEGN